MMTIYAMMVCAYFSDTKETGCYIQQTFPSQEKCEAARVDQSKRLAHNATLTCVHKNVPTWQR